MRPATCEDRDKAVPSLIFFFQRKSINCMPAHKNTQKKKTSTPSLVNIVDAAGAKEQKFGGPGSGQKRKENP